MEISLENLYVDLGAESVQWDQNLRCTPLSKRRGIPSHLHGRVPPRTDSFQLALPTPHRKNDKYYPVSKASLMKPLRLSKVRIEEPGNMVRTSGEPPTTMATECPGPCWVSTNLQLSWLTLTIPRPITMSRKIGDQPISVNGKQKTLKSVSTSQYIIRLNIKIDYCHGSMDDWKKTRQKFWIYKVDAKSSHYSSLWICTAYS